MRTFDFSPLFPSTVGFDRFQRLFDATLERAEQAPNYPPYNIEAVGENDYRITMAIAGFQQDDLEITVENDKLTIGGKTEDADEERTYLHRGIGTRAFSRTFDLADHLKVVGANLANGLLTVDLEREIPEELKPRKIKISKGPAKSLTEKAKALLGAGESKAA